jgi:hypothetical protein
MQTPLREANPYAPSVFPVFVLTPIGQMCLHHSRFSNTMENATAPAAAAAAGTET